MDKFFFDTVRPMFKGLKQHQVEGCEKVIAEGKKRGTSRLHLAYILGTTYHETGKWMQPIREGGYRYGPTYSHASAVRAVTAIYNKGIISTNYALPAGPHRLSYYGRGLVQITWYDNYLKFGIAENPDAALEWDTSLRIMFDGMEKGMFRKGRDLSMIKSRSDYYAARDIINGDVRKNGRRIANEAEVFYKALKNYKPGAAEPTAPATSPRPEPRPTPEVVEAPVKETTNDSSTATGGWTPAWWPFRSS